MPRRRRSPFAVLPVAGAWLALLLPGCDEGGARVPPSGHAAAEDVVLDLLAETSRAELLADRPRLLFGTPAAEEQYEEADLRHLSDSQGWISRADGGQGEPGALLVGGRARFRLTVLRPAPGELELTGTATPHGEPGGEVVLAVTVNGRPAGEARLPRGLQPVTVTLPLAPGALVAGVNEIELSLPDGVQAELPELPFPVTVSGWFTTARLTGHEGPDPRALLAVHDGRRLVQASGTVVRHHHLVGTGERLLATVTARGAALEAALALEADGALPQTLLQRTLAPGESAELDADLQPFAGAFCRLSLTAGRPGEEQRGGRLEWHAPRIVRRDPADRPAAAGPDDAVVRPLAPAALAPVRRPDIVVVLLDAASAFFFRAFGGDTVHAPAIEELAAGSVVFTQAVAPAPYTLPSVGSLMTGLLPDRHGVVHTARAGGGNVRLASEVPTLAEALQAQGYATYGVVTNPNAAGVYGYDRGFHRYDELFADEALWDEGVDPHATVQRALALLAEHEAERGSQPFFLYVHLFPPHAPYAPGGRGGGEPGRPPPGSRAELDALKALPPARRDPATLERLRALYAGNLARADAATATLLAGLREHTRPDELLLAVCADHGEAFGEHGDVEHGRHLYEETLRVPLLLRLPGGAGAGRRIEAPVSLLDLAPTLAAAGGGALPLTDGLDLLSRVRGEEGWPDRVHVARSDVFRPTWSLRWRGWVYLYDALNRRSELYSLSDDPRQQKEIARERPVVASALRARLCRELCALLARPAGEAVQLDPSFVSAVEHIGYVGTRGDLAPPPACPLARRPP